MSKSFKHINPFCEQRYAIVDFLNECEEQDYELDADDIRHILDLDFDYVRKSQLETLVTDGCTMENEK